MNKCDMLEKKIETGVSVKKSLPNSGDRRNDAASVTKCKLSSGRAYMDRRPTFMNECCRFENELQGDFAAVFAARVDVGYCTFEIFLLCSCWFFC